MGLFDILLCLMPGVFSNISLCIALHCYSLYSLVKGYIAICVQACGEWFRNVRFTFQNIRSAFQNTRFPRIRNTSSSLFNQSYLDNCLGVVVRLDFICQNDKQLIAPLCCRFNALRSHSHIYFNREYRPINFMQITLKCTPLQTRFPIG